MKKQNLFYFILFIFQQSFAQNTDYIVTWNDDTIYCSIAESPKKVGFKFIKNQDYFYDYVIATFGEDSTRIYHPANIKAYFTSFTKKNGTPINLIMQSDSVNIVEQFFFKNEQSKFKRNKFIRTLIKDGFYKLYFFEDYEFNVSEKYFVLENNQTKQRTTFFNTNNLRKLLEDWPNANSKNKRYRHWFTGKQYLVIDYNNFKARTLNK